MTQLKSFERDEKGTGAGRAREINRAKGAGHFVAELEGVAVQRVNAERWFAFEIADADHFDLHRKLGGIDGVRTVEERLIAAARGEARGGERQADRFHGFIRKGLAADDYGNRLPDS